MKLTKYQNSSTSIFSFAIKWKYWVLGFICIFPLGTMLSIFSVYSLYEAMLKRSNRLPNIRSINKEFRLNLISDFIDKKFNPIDRYTIILGDSQFYGFGVTEKQTFPSLLSENFPDKKIINMSIVEGRSTDAILILKLLLDKNIKLEKIIYSVNLSHYQNGTTEGFGRLPKDYSDKNILRHTFKLLNTYWVDFLVHEIVDWEKSHRFVANARRAPTLSSKPRRNIKYLNGLLELIKINSESHLFVLPPYSEKALALAGIKRDAFSREALYFENFVKNKGGNFMNLTFELDSHEYFIDVIHFSPKGHQKVADFLISFLATTSLKNVKD